MNFDHCDDFGGDIEEAVSGNSAASADVATSPSAGNVSPRLLTFNPSVVLCVIWSDKRCQNVFAFMASRGTVGGSTRGPKALG